MWNDLAEHIGFIVQLLFVAVTIIYGLIKGILYLNKRNTMRDEKDIDNIKNIDLRKIYDSITSIKVDGFGKIYDRIRSIEQDNAEIKTNYLERFDSVNKLIYETRKDINNNISGVKIQVTELNGQYKQLIIALNNLECMRGKCPIT